MKKLNMAVVNVIIVIVLIAMTIYMFHRDNINNDKIKDLRNRISRSLTVIDSLKNDNTIINSDIGLLKDSVTRYKTTVQLYNDSVVKIRYHYENISNDVYVLTDSSSVLYFKQYLSNYSKRHSKITD